MKETEAVRERQRQRNRGRNRDPEIMIVTSGERQVRERELVEKLPGLTQILIPSYPSVFT